MEYITELRKLVGHRPIIMVGATILLLNSEKELLLMHRTDNNLWGPPGGSLELGESLEDCAKRETLEETGISLDKLTLFGIYSGPEMFYIYPNGDQVHVVTAVYEAQINANQILLSQEHNDFRFYPFNEIPAEISHHIKIIINDFVSKYKK